MVEKMRISTQTESPERLRYTVDSLLEPGVGRMNEDALFIREGQCGVFDGASSLNGYTDDDGRTGGYLASHILQETFAHSDRGLVETFIMANRAIAEAMSKKGIDASQKENTWSSTMAVIAIDEVQKKFEWIQMADALIIVIKKDGTYEVLITDDYDHDRKTLMLWKEMADQGVTDIRAKINDTLITLRRTANIEYGTVNGDPNAERFLRKGVGSLEGITHILLFTDGMIPPKKDPNAQDDFTELVSWFQEGGLTKVKERIREREGSDPNCREYPRYKKSDDIGALAVCFE